MRTGLAAKRRRLKQAVAEIRRLQLSILFLERNGFVEVLSSGWQRGRQEDVLSLTPKYSWSHYTWEAGGSPAHPKRCPAGAWFTVSLPAGLWIIPSHYALRHGDDCVPHAPAVRHDSNASTWDGTLHKTIAPTTMPVTSWGSTTRAQRTYAPNALVEWQLWGAESREGGAWILLGDHRGDTGLHAAWGEAVWEVRCQDEQGVAAKARRKLVKFMVVMTGPTANGGHGLFCSGFDVFGQTGLEREKRPPPQAPHGLRYKFDNELYVCDGAAIIPNECHVLGTNDDQCPMTFVSHPELPHGLVVDPRNGTISGRLVLAELGAWTTKVRQGQRLSFTVTCSNCVGKATTRVSLTIIAAPRHFGYKHTDVTYEIGDAHMAFSKELMAAAQDQGWRRPRFLPVDLPRDVESNGIREECDLGSCFSWPDDIPLPTRGGVPVLWSGPLSWPRFELVAGLPEGLALDARTARCVPSRSGMRCCARFWFDAVDRVCGFV